MKYKAGAINVVIVQPTDTPTGLYDPSGAIRVCVSDGSKFVGAYAPNGALWATTDPATRHPINAPDGSVYMTTSVVSGFYISTGAMNIAV